MNEPDQHTSAKQPLRIRRALIAGATVGVIVCGTTAVHLGFGLDGYLLYALWIGIFTGAAWLILTAVNKRRMR